MSDPDLDDDATRWMLGEQRRSARAILGVGLGAVAVAVALVAITAALGPRYATLVLRLRLMGAILGVIGVVLAAVGAVYLAKVRRARRAQFPGVPAAIARPRSR